MMPPPAAPGQIHATPIDDCTRHARRLAMHDDAFLYSFQHAVAIALGVDVALERLDS